MSSDETRRVLAYVCRVWPCKLRKGHTCAYCDTQHEHTLLLQQRHKHTITDGRAVNRRVLVVVASVVEQEVAGRARKETERKNERCKPLWLAGAWARCTRTWVWAVKRRSFGWKRSILITNTRVPYKVYNSVPVVLYLKPFRTTGCTS